MAALRCLSRLGNSIGTSLYIHRSRFLPAQLTTTRDITSKLFVAGLSFYTTDEGLSEAFSQFGQVLDAKIITDRASGRSRGFGFVTFASEDEAQKATSEMNGKVLNGRVVYVEASKPKQFLRDSLPIASGPPNAQR